MREFTQLLGVFTALATLVVGSSIYGQSGGEKGRGKPIKGEPIRAATRTNIAPANVSGEKKQEPEPEKTQTMDGEFQVVNFTSLANFEFEVPQGIVAAKAVGKSNEQIPAEVRSLNQKKVALTGFMLPLKVDNGLVSEMLIMKDQSMCCYGAQPRINDWVSVKMAGKGVKSVMDQPVTVYGQIRVGEMLENGYLIGIYEMSGEKIDVSQE